MLITKVKVGKVTNLSEARYCAGMGVDFLSFPITDVDPKTFQEITGWVAGPLFGVEVEKENLHLLPQYGGEFTVASAEAMETVSTEKLIIRLTPEIWSIEKPKLLQAKKRILFLEFIISSINPRTQSVLEDASKGFQLLLNIPDGLSPDQILKLPVAGISLEGGAEVRPGLKEYHLAEILEKLEEA